MHENIQKHMETIELEGENRSKFSLTYSVKEKEPEVKITKSEETVKDSPRSSRSSSTEDSLLKDEVNVLAILKMGGLIHSFIQKLDPLVYLYGKAKHVVLW